MKIKKYFPMLRKILITSVLGILVIFALISIYVGPARIGKLPPVPNNTVRAEKPEVTLILDFKNSEVATVSTSANTPFDALENYAAVQGFTVKTKQYDFGIFVETIRDLSNNKDNAWIYSVNGKSGLVASDKYKLKTGDIVEWRYVKPIY